MSGFAAYRPPTLCDSFISKARETWSLILLGAAYGLIPGEETLTDLNLLTLKAVHPVYVEIRLFSRHQETALGADWEIWFNAGARYLGLRVQAKKLDPRTGRYETLRGMEAASQADNLITRAAAERPPRWPMYVLYNGWHPTDAVVPAWNCPTYARDESMFGCAIASAESVRGCIVAGTVDLVSVLQAALPWSCLVCCRGWSDGDLVDRAQSLLGVLAGEETVRGETTEAPPAYVSMAFEPQSASEPSEPDLSHVLLVSERRLRSSATPT
jgi:hypothetical protein